MRRTFFAIRSRSFVYKTNATYLTRDDRDALLALALLENAEGLLADARRMHASAALVVLRDDADVPVALLLAMPNPREAVVAAIERVTDPGVPETNPPQEHPKDMDITKRPQELAQSAPRGPLNARIEARMKELDIATVREFAEHAGIGRTQLHELVRRREGGGEASLPSLTTLARLAGALDCPTHELLYALMPQAPGAPQEGGVRA